MFLRQASARAEDTALPHMVLGRILEDSGDSRGALEAYEAAVHAELENADAQLLLSMLQEKHLKTAQHPGEVRNE